MKLQPKEAEGSCHGSTVSPSLISKLIDEDKNSVFKSWLSQNSDIEELLNKGKRVKILASVDSEPSLSWIDKYSADQLNLWEVKRGLMVSGINGTEFHDSELVKVTDVSKDY